MGSAVCTTALAGYKRLATRVLLPVLGTVVLSPDSWLPWQISPPLRRTVVAMASQFTIATSTPRSSLAYKEQAIGSKARLRDLEVPRRDSHFLSHALPPHKVRCRHARSPQ